MFFRLAANSSRCGFLITTSASNLLYSIVHVAAEAGVGQWKWVKGTPSYGRQQDSSETYKFIFPFCDGNRNVMAHVQIYGFQFVNWIFPCANCVGKAVGAFHISNILFGSRTVLHHSDTAMEQKLYTFSPTILGSRTSQLPTCETIRIISVEGERCLEIAGIERINRFVSIGGNKWIRFLFYASFPPAIQ